MKPKNLIRNLLIVGLFTFSFQSANTQVKVLSTGKVGFGITNPQWGTIEIGNDGNHSGLAIYDPSAGGSTFRMFRIGSYGYLTRGGDTDRGIRMNDDGRTEVFYRSTTPYSYGFVSTVQAYNVRGLAVSYQGVHTFKVYGDGGVEGLHFWSSSDEKLKEDIVKLDKSLDRVLKLEGVSYKFKKKDVVPEA